MPQLLTDRQLSPAPPALPPFLVETDPTTDFTWLPHATWNDEWRPVLRRFAAEVPRMRCVRLVTCDDLPLHMRARLAWVRSRTGRGGLHGQYFDTWHVPVRAIRDAGLRREMLAFAESMYRYELPPGGAVMLTDMLDGPSGDDALLQLYGWLRAALAELAGAPSQAIVAPTGNSGELVDPDHHDAGTDEDDHRLAPHPDLWVPSMLFNIFHRVVEGAGHTTLMPMRELWPTAEECGVPAETVDAMKLALTDAGECDYYAIFAGLMYDDHPWSDRLEEALFARSATGWMKPGEGYFVSDREWLHGRTSVSPAAVAPEHKQHRLYRLAYNNARLVEASRERRIAWEKAAYYPGGCKA